MMPINLLLKRSLLLTAVLCTARTNMFGNESFQASNNTLLVDAVSSPKVAWALFFTLFVYHIKRVNTYKAKLDFFLGCVFFLDDIEDQPILLDGINDTQQKTLNAVLNDNFEDWESFYAQFCGSTKEAIQTKKAYYIQSTLAPFAEIRRKKIIHDLKNNPQPNN